MNQPGATTTTTTAEKAVTQKATENPFSMASMTSLYADDDSVADRRRQLFKFTNSSSENRDPPKALDTWWCGWSRTVWIIILVALSAIVLALVLGLGLGLGLKKEAPLTKVEPPRYVEYFAVENGVELVSSWNEGNSGALSCAQCLGENHSQTRVVDLRSPSSLFKISFATFSNGAKASDAAAATSPACSEDCPIHKLLEDVEAEVSAASAAAITLDNTGFHLAWMSKEINQRSLTAATYEDSLYPFPSLTGSSNQQLFQQESKTLPLGSVEADALVAWRGWRFNQTVEGVVKGVSRYAICEKTGSENVTEDSHLQGTVQENLCRRVRTVYNNTWYAEQLDKEMLAQVSTESLDDLVGLSLSYTELAEAQSCVDKAAGAGAGLHLWVDEGSETYYTFTMNSDSATITPISTNLNQLFSVVLLTCRCPAGGMHRFMGVDTLTVSFAEYHDCVLATVAYRFRENAANTGYYLTREYAAPTTFLGLGPASASDLANVTCSRFASEDLTSVMKCAFFSGLRWYSTYTEGTTDNYSGSDCQSISC